MSHNSNSTVQASVWLKPDSLDALRTAVYRYRLLSPRTTQFSHSCPILASALARSSRLSERLTTEVVRNIFQRVAAEAGIEPFHCDGPRGDPSDVTPHALRHSVAYWMMNTRTGTHSTTFGIGSATVRFKPPSECLTTLSRCESLSVSHVPTGRPFHLFHDLLFTVHAQFSVVEPLGSASKWVQIDGCILCTRINRVSAAKTPRDCISFHTNRFER